MIPPLRQPLFLERGTYRRRRLMDAARLLPVAGMALVCLPLMWSRPTEAGGAATAGTAIYLFLIWILLILAAAAIARGLGRGFEPSDATAPRAPSEPPGPLAPGAAGPRVLPAGTMTATTTGAPQAGPVSGGALPQAPATSPHGDTGAGEPHPASAVEPDGPLPCDGPAGDAGNAARPAGPDDAGRAGR